MQRRNLEKLSFSKEAEKISISLSICLYLSLDKVVTIDFILLAAFSSRCPGCTHHKPQPSSCSPLCNLEVTPQKLMEFYCYKIT